MGPARHLGSGDAVGQVRARIDQLRGKDPERNRALLVPILEGLAREAPQRARELAESWERGAVDEVERGAHSLKGSAGNLGATGLEARCAQWEAWARSGTLPTRSAPAGQLQDEVAAACEALRLVVAELEGRAAAASRVAS